MDSETITGGPPLFASKRIDKVPTGIAGLDEVLDGGLPRGRAIVITGGPGSGKTVLASEFLYRGAAEYGDPGVLVSFEEKQADLTHNMEAFDWDLRPLLDSGQLQIREARISAEQAVQTGPFDLSGLMALIDEAVRKNDARRVVLDGLDNLLAAFTDERRVRAAFLRVVDGLRDQGLTVVVTCGRGREGLTRHGVEDYLSDCVLAVDHRVEDRIPTRRLRVVKYRGARHGTNEYPFFVAADGIRLVPVTEVRLDYPVSEERISTGIADLDRMFDNAGPYRGSLTLLSGTAGTGKTSLAANFVAAACARGEPALFISFEESGNQIRRNMAGVGCDLARWVEIGLLRFEALRPTRYGLEEHLAGLQKAVAESAPLVAVIDPISAFDLAGSSGDIRSMITRVLDELRSQGISVLLTYLADGPPAQESTDLAVSSIADNWIQMRSVERNGERRKMLSIVKARGVAHSTRTQELVIATDGLSLLETHQEVEARPGGD